MINTIFSPLEGPQVVKANLNISYLRFRLRCCLYIIVVSTIVFVLLYATTPQSSGIQSIYQLLSSGYQACFMVISPFIVFYCVYIFLNIPSLREHEQRRQAAAYGDQHYLAVEQPISDMNALSLPFTMKSDPDWFILLTSLIVMLPCMSVFVLAWSHFRPDPLFDFLLAIIAGICVLFFCIFLLVKLYLLRSMRLMVTEDGLTLLRGRVSVHHLAWNDIRLFAIDTHLFTLKKNRPTIFFEVAGVHEVIYWSWKSYDKSRDSHMTRLAPLAEEQDKQIQALFSLIVARTELPLYDLQRRGK